MRTLLVISLNLLLLLGALLAPLLSAETVPPIKPALGLLHELQVPNDLRLIRELQLEAATRGSVQLTFIHRENSAATRIVGIPSEIREMTVYGEEQVNIALEALAPYFALGGDDFFRIVEKDETGPRWHYTAEHFINGLSTNFMLRITVDRSSARISDIDGWVILTHDIETEPAVSKAAAIERVRTRLSEHPELRTLLGVSTEEVDLDGDVSTELVYRSFGEHGNLRLFWLIGVELENSIEFEDGPEITHYHYLVNPDGNVSRFGSFITVQ